MAEPSSSPAVRRRTVLAAMAGAAFGPAARAQGSAAAGTLRLVVPFTPGTGIDIVARQIAPPLAERLKRPVFVDNRPGASGNIGTLDVVRAAPDGATLLVSVNTLVMNPALFPKAGFNPLTDLAPVGLTSRGHLLLVAGAGTGLDSLPTLIARAKARPGALNYASPGAGTPHHLAMELLKNRARVSLTHIAYRGTAPALTDLLGGRIDAMFLPLHVALPHVKAGKLVALAIGSETPNPLLPTVPPLGAWAAENMARVGPARGRRQGAKRRTGWPPLRALQRRIRPLAGPTLRAEAIQGPIRRCRLVVWAYHTASPAPRLGP